MAILRICADKKNITFEVVIGNKNKSKKILCDNTIYFSECIWTKLPKFLNQQTIQTLEKIIIDYKKEDITFSRLRTLVAIANTISVVNNIPVVTDAHEQGVQEVFFKKITNHNTKI